MLYNTEKFKIGDLVKPTLQMTQLSMVCNEKTMGIVVDVSARKYVRVHWSENYGQFWMPICRLLKVSSL